MSETRKPILVAICDALAAAVTQCQSLAVAVTDLCPQSSFDKLSALTIRVTPFTSSITSMDRSDTRHMDAKFTVWVASPGGADAVEPGIQLVEDIANGLLRASLQLSGQAAGRAVITKAEIMSVYDLERLLTSHVFLSAIRVHVTTWYKP